MSTVSGILNNLGGVYRDTIRVSSEANKLLNNQNGRHLRPNHSSLMENNGTFHTRLFVFQGTISITFRRSTYNIPVEIFLLPNFPIRPPVCFVRPTENMMIKENHRHVGRDGMVYMPYLSQWRNGSHNLLGTVQQMQQIFAQDPPVFSKPVQQVAPNVNHVSNGNTRPPMTNPPGYNDIQAAIEASKREEEERRMQEQIEAQIEKSKLEQARNESLQQAQRKAQEERTAQEAREKLTRKLQADLKSFFDTERVEIVKELKTQKKLEEGEITVKNQLTELETRKEKLIEAIEKVDETNAQLEQWIDIAEIQQKEMKENENVDALVQTNDIHSQQMLKLACTNASLSDALYFLDRALVKGTIELDVHLKKVRALAKKQFLVKAHLLKIAEYRANNAR